MTQTTAGPHEGRKAKDELYAYEKFVKIAGGDEAEAHKSLREIGYDPTEKPTVPGAEIVAYFAKKLNPHPGSVDDASRESSE